MIVFKSIRWKNFLSTGNVFTEINLATSGPTLIVGENGAGKSTILDALSFGLYGKPFRNVAKNQLLNSINKKGLVVEVEWSVGSKQYMVRRGIKPNIFEIYVNDFLIDQNADAKGYQEMLEKQILKFNHKSFNQIVILGSASFTPFMQLPAAHRREIIEDLLDINIFSKMNVLLKDKIQNNKDEIYKIENNIHLVEEKIKMQVKHLESVQSDRDEIIKQKHDQLQLNREEQATYETHFESLTKTKSLIQTKIDETEPHVVRLATLQELEGKIEDNIIKAKKEIAFFEKNSDCPTCKQTINHTFKHETLTQKQEQLNKQIEGVNKIADEIAKLLRFNAQYDKLKNELDDINKLLVKTSNEISILKRLADKLNEDVNNTQNNNTIIESGNQNIESLQQENENLVVNLEEQRKSKQLLEVAGYLLKDTGIKTRIIKQYIPIMNKLINKYLASMDFFVNFELNERFEETIKSRFRDDFTYQSFSEGEKMRIDIALLFTWRTIAKLRNSASTNLLIMDEIFDSSLSQSGVDELMKILNSLTKDNNTFIISHKGDQLADKFTNIVRFEKHKNFSRMIS